MHRFSRFPRISRGSQVLSSTRRSCCVHQWLYFYLPSLSIFKKPISQVLSSTRRRMSIMKRKQNNAVDESPSMRRRLYFYLQASYF
ncbi:hypothetical protein HN51_008574 [Arachis hypogaea]